MISTVRLRIGKRHNPGDRVTMDLPFNKNGRKSKEDYESFLDQLNLKDEFRVSSYSNGGKSSIRYYQLQNVHDITISESINLLYRAQDAIKREFPESKIIIADGKTREYLDGLVTDGPGPKTIIESLNPYHRTTRKGRPGQERPQSRNPKEAKESLEAFGLQALQEFYGKKAVEDRTKERGFDYHVYLSGVLYAVYDTKNDSDLDRLSIFQYGEALRFIAAGVKVFTISRKRIKEWKADTIWEPTGYRGYSPSELIA